MSNVLEIKTLSSGIKLLYVEDDESIRVMMLAYLEKFFDHIDVCENGLDGLEKYRQGQHDLVITDILMPKMNGLEMIKKIRDINVDQEVIISSAYSDADYFIKAIELGVTGYLIKPTTHELILDTLSRGLKQVALRKENYEYKNNLEGMLSKKIQEEQALQEEKLLGYSDADVAKFYKLTTLPVSTLALKVVDLEKGN